MTIAVSALAAGVWVLVLLRVLEDRRNRKIAELDVPEFLRTPPTFRVNTNGHTGLHPRSER